MVVYRLLAGPFAGKYVYIVENITVSVRKGQTVRVWRGAPSGYVTSIPPDQRMPRGWPKLPAHHAP
jgi:hypothetical protein